MADILLAEQSAPATPANGNGVVYVDSTASMAAFKDDGGRSALLGGGSFNAAVAAQAGFAADTYLTNSDLLIPSFGLQAKSLIRWIISVSKTAAGVATPIYTVRFGSLRTTGDASRLALTGSAQTAAADQALIQVYLTVRNIGAAGVIQGTVTMDHNLAATGFASNAAGLAEGTSAAFDMTALPGQFIGLSINGGASAAWTITQVRAEALW